VAADTTPDATASWSRRPPLSPWSAPPSRSRPTP